MFEQAQDKTAATSVARDSVIPFGPIAQIDFAKFADVIRRQAGFIGLVTAISLLAMVGFMLMVTPQYTAVTEILINPSEVITEFAAHAGLPQRTAPDNPTKLRVDEIAHAVKSSLEMDDRGFVTELTVFATNPKD